MNTASALELEQTLPDAEAQLSGLMFALMLVDPQLTIRSANPAAESLLSQSCNRMIGRALLEIVTFEDQHVAGHFNASDAPLMARNILVRSGDKAMRVNLSASPVPGRDGWKVITLSEVGQEDGSVDAEARSLRAPAVLAHEIKNPLSAISGAGQLLARKLDENDRPLARLIVEEVDRIARLIDRMQRLGSETPGPVVSTNLHSTIRAAIATVRAGNPGGASVTEEFDPSLPRVLVNDDALQQVLINLLANARDACKKATDPQVAVRTRFVGGLTFRALIPGKSIALPIEITVSDNGSGVEPGLRDQIFEPFVSSKPNGQGLGLALVRKLLRDMNGRITHERDERAGLTHFRVRLPVAD